MAKAFSVGAVIEKQQPLDTLYCSESFASFPWLHPRSARSNGADCFCFRMRISLFCFDESRDGRTRDWPIIIVILPSPYKVVVLRLFILHAGLSRLKGSSHTTERKKERERERQSGKMILARKYKHISQFDALRRRRRLKIAPNQLSFSWISRFSHQHRIRSSSSSNSRNRKRSGKIITPLRVWRLPPWRHYAIPRGGGSFQENTQQTNTKKEGKTE